MTGAGGAANTPLMLDILSSSGVTDAQALAQGPYLKMRRAGGVSRGLWDRRRGVEGLYLSTMEALGCRPAKFSAARGL